MAALGEDWQLWVEQEARKLGLKETSGYRSPAAERALGGPSSSYHSRGSVERPGAIDFGGPADKLAALFQAIKQQFAGSINELFLHVPGGQSSAIKHDRYLGRDPEAGRPQHLHVAIGEGATAPPPAAGIPSTNRGEKALAAAPAEGVCARSISWTTPAAWVAAALGKDQPEGSVHQLCWSDVWFYGAGVGLIVVGVALMRSGAK